MLFILALPNRSEQVRRAAAQARAQRALRKSGLRPAVAASSSKRAVNSGV